MREYQYWYKIIKSSWGISIRIKAMYGSLAECDDFDFIDIGNIKVKVKDKSILEEEKEYIYKGIKRVSKEILSNVKSESNVVIIINQVIFAEMDFQKEGLEAAIIEWASHAFNFTVPQITVTYDKEIRKYYFTYTP